MWQAKAACSEDSNCVGVYKRELWQFSLCLGIRISTKHIEWESRTYRKPDPSGDFANKTVNQNSYMIHTYMINGSSLIKFDEILFQYASMWK